MNEREHYQLARALAEVNAAQRARERYTYACVDADTLKAMAYAPKHEDAYVSEDHQTNVIRKLLDEGFRWIRTEGDTAILEKLL